MWHMPLRDERYYLNLCSHAFSRVRWDRRHSGHVEARDPARERSVEAHDSARERDAAFSVLDLSTSVVDSWRFPFVDGDRDPSQPDVASHNQVSFVYYAGPDAPMPREVLLVGTFAPMYAPIALQPLRETPFLVTTLRVPKGQLHRYLYGVDGRWTVDPVNPQRVTLEDGRVWSRFFTHGCAKPVTFEEDQRHLLERLADHILPLRTQEGQNFLDRHARGLSRLARDSAFPEAYRFDRVIGAVNFIDKLLAREEHHRARDYKICLPILQQLLRQRARTLELTQMPAGLFAELYEQMARDDVPGWPHAQYQSPQAFLRLLRRHVYTGAFSHPKYGGNAGAAGWAYLAERFRGADGTTRFAWDLNCEKPLGRSEDFHG